MACGDGDPAPNAVAASQSALPLAERLNLPDGVSAERTDVVVRDFGEGRREVSWFEAVLAAHRRFVCVVVPDSTDRLRGLRVERLDLQAAADQ